MSAAPIPTPNLDDILKSRGIYEAAQQAGWTNHRNGWRYPVYNSQGKQHQMIHDEVLQPVYRWKNGAPKPTDGSKYAKYLWLPGKYDKAKYYLLPDTLPAIKAARGVCYLASGEPDVLAYRAAGIRNVISRITAEISEPVGFAEDLKLMGVTSLNYYPDRDPAGLKSAAKIGAVLADSDVLYMPYYLPYEAADKHGGDINRLWIERAFDTQRFMVTLLDCEPISAVDLELALADDAPKNAQKRLNFDDAEMGTDKLPRAFKDAILRDVESLPGFKHWKGSQAEFRCPFHDDTNNSAGFNADLMAFNCFVCGGMNAKTYGSNRDINLSDYLERTTPVNVVNATPRLTVQDKPGKSTPVASDPRYTSSDEAWDEVRDLITGKRLSGHAPVPFPFKSFHPLGGFCEMLEPGKVVMIVGPSGGAKTTFLECLMEVEQQNKQDVIWFSPEWNARQLRERAIHRHGGLSLNELRRHKLWKIEEADGVPEQYRKGVEGDAKKIAYTLQLIDRMQGWHGKTHTLNSTLDNNNLTGILATIEGIIVDKREAGRTVSQLGFDYIQRVPGAAAWDKLELAVNAIKSLCERYQIIPWILVQPLKTSGRNAHEGVKLGQADMQGLSDIQSNLMITLNPVLDDAKNRMPYVEACVVKNSEGNTGELILGWSAQYLTILDETYTRRQLSLGE